MLLCLRTNHHQLCILLPSLQHAGPDGATFAHAAGDNGQSDGDDGLRLLQACMDACGDLGLASLRLQSVTATM